MNKSEVALRIYLQLCNYLDAECIVHLEIFEGPVLCDRVHDRGNTVTYIQCKERVMSVALKMEMLDEAFSALHKSPDEFLQEMRLTAAVKWYEMTLISQEKAAQIAGVTRVDFIAELERFRVSPFQYSVGEVLDELSNAD